MKLETEIGLLVLAGVEISRLKSIIQNQDETISEILDELEENEEEIYTLQSLAAGQSMALIEKDKYIEQLECCILNQREEIKELEDRHNENMIKYLKSVIHRQDNTIKELYSKENKFR
jgi:peptidoglycan hydrolase CwlO-like protein